MRLIETFSECDHGPCARSGRGQPAAAVTTSPAFTGLFASSMVGATNPEAERNGRASDMHPIEDLKKQFRETFELTEPVEWSGVRYRETKAWTSVAHMQLVAAIEDLFGIMLDTDDVIDMSSFERAIEILKKYDVHFAT